MTRRLALTLMAVFTLALASGGSLAAHPGHEHKVMGTVTMAASDHVMLKDTAGKDVTVYIGKDTKVLKDKKAATVDDIKAGMRVVITAVVEKEKTAEKMVAKTIELGAATTR